MRQLLTTIVALMFICSNAKADDQALFDFEPWMNDPIDTKHTYKRQSAINGYHQLLQQQASDNNATQTDDSETIANSTNQTEVPPALPPYEWHMRNFRYFNKGFKGRDLARNFSNCGEDGIFWWFYERETYSLKMKYGDFEESTFNTTLFLQNTTELAFTCTDALENIYYFYDLKTEQFPTFDDLFLGFLQSILGNVLRLERIQTKIKELGEEEEVNPNVDNAYKYWYYGGIIANIMLVFEPVAEKPALFALEQGLESSHSNLMSSSELGITNPHNSLHRLRSARDEPDQIVNDSEYEDLDNMTGMDSFLTPLGIIDFTQGVFYGTGLINNSTHLQICVDILSQDYVKGVYSIINDPLRGESLVFPSLYEFYNMIWSIHPLLINCYNAPDSMWWKLGRKFDDLDDIRTLLINIVHNVSFAHDAYREVYEFFASEERGQAKEGPYDAGFGAGRMVYYLVADNTEDKQRDPARGYYLPDYYFF